MARSPSVASASLSAFRQDLRQYQRAAVDHAKALLDLGEARAMFSAPTGTGKGTIELALIRELREAGREALILTPALDVVRGYLERCGASREGLAACSEDRLAALGEDIGVFTPVRYRNLVMLGERCSAEVFIVDEAHHNTDGGEVSGTLFAIAPEAQWVGFTATPFRGSPNGTRLLREAWGEPWTILTVPEAIELGACALPWFEVRGLVDDDRIEVRNGQFVVASADRHVGSRVSELVQIARAEARGAPTVLVVPSTDVARLCVENGAEDPDLMPLRFVGHGTSAIERARAFGDARERRAVLVTIAVLREGVDMPWLRTMVDAAPTLSPVTWAQRVGRVMRPGDPRPRYICACRNLERHAYILQGAVPRHSIAAAQQAFDGPSKLSSGRAIGLEALKKFKQVPVPMLGGLWSSAWVLYSSDGDGRITQYVSILHPEKEGAICARRVNVHEQGGEVDWGKWERCDVPADLVGFSTVPIRNGLSDKQKAFWRKCARGVGLDPSAADNGLTSRQFFVMPVLLQIKERI